jgi:hypothetical protein
VLPTLKNTTIEMLFGEQKFWKEHFIKKNSWQPHFFMV